MANYSRYYHIRQLDDALEELQELHHDMEWAPEEVGILRATVRLQEVIRDLEKAYDEESYDSLEEQFLDTMEDYFTQRRLVDDLKTKVAELEVELGEFQAKWKFLFKLGRGHQLL